MTTSIVQLARDPAGDASRAAFEDAAWAEYLKARKQGPVDGDVDGEPTREGCFWRKPSGAYGVKQWNAAWWAWRSALALPVYSESRSFHGAPANLHNLPRREGADG